jgi:hypothetical protein
MLIFKKKSNMTIPLLFRSASVYLVAVVIMASSCSSSRFYKGFEYKGSTQAPDMSGQTTTGTEISNMTGGTEINASTLVGDMNAIAPVHLSGSNPDGGLETGAASVQPETVQKMLEATLDQIQATGGPGKGMTPANLASQVASGLAASGQISPLTDRQEKKLQKLATRMDRKMKKQAKEIDWKNNSDLELFFMIMAIAGLVLGILTIGFGWFVFIVFAGLWLYWKLVKDKNGSDNLA